MSDELIENCRVCEHGNLARVCLTCEQAAELSALRQRAERAEAALNKSMEIVSEYYPDAMGELVLRVEAVCMLGRMAHDASFAAQSTIADLTGQVERMSEALEWFADSRNYEDTEQRVAYLKDNPVWSKGIGIARAALGGDS